MSKADELWRRLQLADGIGSGVDLSKPATRDPQEAGERRYRELGDGTDASDSRQTGWAVLYGPEEKARAEPHLTDLLALRRAQAGENRFREMVVPTVDGICVSGQRFLFETIEEAPGVVDIERLPYYVLIVASPQEVPWEFQFELAINRAVGRLYFDEPKDYARYASAVKAVEESRKAVKKADPKRTLGFFFVERELMSNGKPDKATPILADFLVEPVPRRLKATSPSWKTPVIRGDEGRADRLREILEGRAQTGAGWVVLSHGVEAKLDSQTQPERQGGISCIHRPLYGKDLNFQNSPKGALLGKTFVLTACFGAGTTEFNEFESPKAALEGDVPKAERIASAPFVARLPQRLLAQGSLGVFGHVGKGLTATYRWLHGPSATEAARSFSDMLVRILRGQRLGHAMRPMARRASNISSHFLPYLRAWVYDPGINYREIELQWKAWIDARNFVLLGDPAARSLQDGLSGQASGASAKLPLWRSPAEPAWEKGAQQTFQEPRDGSSSAIPPLRWAVKPADKASTWTVDLSIQPSGPGLGAPAWAPAEESRADLVIQRQARGRQFRNAEPASPGYWQIRDVWGKAQSPPVALDHLSGQEGLAVMVRAAARAHVAHRLSERKTVPRIAVEWRWITDQEPEPVESVGLWRRHQAIRLLGRNASSQEIWIKLGVWCLDQRVGFQEIEMLRPDGGVVLDLERPDFQAPFGLLPRPEQIRAHLIVLAASDPQVLSDLTDPSPDSLISELNGLRLPSYRWLSLPNWSFHIRSVWYEL